MQYIYHIVPDKIKGKTLYPLNILKSKFPEIYNLEIKKYSGREEVLKRKIPILNCLWNDVLHFTPVNPKKIINELAKLGIRKSFSWYKIDASKLDKNKSVIYLYKFKKGNPMSLDNFKEYDHKKMSRLDKIPKRALDYYKQCVKEGKSPLLFHFIPHILLKDSLDITNVEIIKS